MFNKFELFGAGISVLLMAVAIYLVQVQSSFSGGNQAGNVISSQAPGVVIVEQSENTERARVDAYLQASDDRGNINSMVIDDVKLGVGDEVKKGDTVSVHYVGTLQNGQEFDNSKKRGDPFEFIVGKGMVIEGWDKGLVGMKVGGQRILIIPSDMAYGDNGVGPIPGGATLVFSIELLAIK